MDEAGIRTLLVTVTGPDRPGVTTQLFDALSAFHAAHPGVELSLLEDGSDRLIERVRSGIRARQRAHLRALDAARRV